MKTPLPVYLRVLIMLPLLFVVSGYINLLRAQNTKFGNSYINVSKKTVGGTVMPGDILEIRTCYYFKSGYNSNAVYYVRYLDNVPTNTIFTDDSLRLITNEGLVYKRWTIGADTDPGTYNASPSAGEFNIKINLGRSATAPSGTSANTSGSATVFTGGSSKDKPRVGGGNVLITTSFKVMVTGNIGDTIILGAGELRYKTTNSSGATDVVVPAIQYKILIANNDPICPNAIGKNFVAESGGTFDSGSVQNRSTPPTFLIPGYTYLNNMGPGQAIGDGTYGIVNNLSPWASTYQNAEKKNNCVISTAGSPPAAASCANRMFSGHWDIIGDHTGTVNAAGNAPAATGAEGGYMLVVNADYATSEAYRQTISGLCPNTTYEFSLWVKNVCTNCGVDSSGTSTYKPGVLPTLSFSIDGLDRYSSGQIDTTGWQKKGFLFKTDTAQSSITISIRNNASGGGGNDWAIDDIALVTCNPNLNLIPSGDQQICYNTQVDISSTVTSFFDNYTFYRFERSTDNGASWTVSGSGSGSPAPVTGGYEYTALLTPSFLADSAHHLNQYRFIVASSAANLANTNCAFMASTKIIVMVNNCTFVLNMQDDRRLRRPLENDDPTAIRKLINPFTEQISFSIFASENSHAIISVFDNYGRMVKRLQSKVTRGNNPFTIDQLSRLSKGTYFLKIDLKNQSFNRILVKTL